MLGAVSTGITPDAVDEYFKAFGDEDRRNGQLELYRSGDFEKLEPYEGKLAQLGVPTLLLWGADDFAAPVAGAHRFEGEIPGSEVVVLDGTGHFVVEDAPDRYAEALVALPQDGRARARHAELVVALVALVDRAGGVDVDGQHLPGPGTAGPGPRRARARRRSSSGACAGVSVVPSTDTTTSNAPAGVRPRLTTGTR